MERKRRMHRAGKGLHERAVITVRGFRVPLRTDQLRQKYEVHVLPLCKGSGMSVRDLDREAEISCGQFIASTHGFFVGAGRGHNLEPELIEESAPERIEIVAGQRARNADRPGRSRFQAGAVVEKKALYLAHRLELAMYANPFLIRVATAHVTPARPLGLAFNLGESNLAVILAQVALLGAQRNLPLREAQTLEPRCRGIALHVSFHQQRHSIRAHNMAVRRDHHLHTQQVFEGSHQPFVPRGGALEKDPLTAGMASSDHFVQVVPDHAVEYGSDAFLTCVALADEAIHILFHEHRAAVGGDRRRNAHDQVADLFERESEFSGLFFHERAGACGADVVHVAVNDTSVDCVDILRILAADFEDRVHATVHVYCAGQVRGNLVRHEVSAHDLAHELAARAGCAHAQHFHLGPFSAREFLDGREQMPGCLDRIPGSAAINISEHLFIRAHENHLG